ncbi:MAG: YggS family pyridoxal phosphate-dependent enzyme [Propionibacteriaceae bacterium]|nr:YggS family pyridoxal phosphate-dependent enzyme [Propionibacteriaceae bacterium]
MTTQGLAAPDDGLARRIANVQARMADAAQRVGRQADVKLLAVSKTRPIDAIKAAAEVDGLAGFAENRPQELATKAEALTDLDVNWVLIGPLQTNKATLAARWANQFQALDSLGLAQALDRRLQAAGRGLDVLIEVNTSGEAAKHGVAPDDALALARGLAPFASLRPVGLMTVAVNSQDDAAVRACFRKLRQIQSQLRDDGVCGVPWDELSMGMSSDFEWAIEEGSTMVRIGTAIFGPR